MMGQQQTVMAGSAAVRRLLLVLLVAALMAVMLVSMAAPAFARGFCPGTQQHPTGPKPLIVKPAEPGQPSITHFCSS
jgi:hypothetical protein